MRGPRKFVVAWATGHCTTQVVQAIQASGLGCLRAIMHLPYTHWAACQAVARATPLPLFSVAKS